MGCLPLAVGAVIGAVVAPVLVYVIVDLLLDLFDTCNGSGEERMGCAWELVIFTVLSVLPGAVIGFVVAYAIGARANTTRSK